MTSQVDKTFARFIQDTHCHGILTLPDGRKFDVDGDSIYGNDIEYFENMVYHMLDTVIKLDPPVLFNFL